MAPQSKPSKAPKTSNTAASGSASKPRPNLRQTLDGLAQLYAQPNAPEELAASWPAIAPLANALAGSGRSPAPIPLGIVVRTLKAQWHRDGTWPLVAADEQLAPGDPRAALPRSQHASNVLLQPAAGIAPPPLPLTLTMELEHGKADPECEAIARRYAARGLDMSVAPGNFD